MESAKLVQLVLKATLGLLVRQGQLGKMESARLEQLAQQVLKATLGQLVPQGQQVALAELVHQAPRARQDLRGQAYLTYFIMVLALTEI
jgi:hypothetical protein